MNRQHILPVLAASILPLTGCVLGIGPFPAAETELSATVEHVDGAPVDVHTQNGSVEVVADPSLSEVMIEAAIRCTDDTWEAAEARVLDATLDVSRGTDGTLFVTAGCPGFNDGNDGADVTVHLPAARGAVIDTSNGRVFVQGLTGTLVTRSSNGSVTVDGHDGPVDLETSNGTIEAGCIGGPATLRTSNGNIRVSLNLDVAGPLDAVTSNGSIEARVGEAFAGRVEMTTSNGAVSVQDRPGRILEQELEDTAGWLDLPGEGTSSLTSSNGNVRFFID